MISYYRVDKGEKMLQQILSILYKLKVQSLIVEGGAKLLQSFIDEGLWDEARVISNEQLTIGNGVSAPILPANKPERTIQVETDIIETYLPTV